MPHQQRQSSQACVHLRQLLNSRMIKLVCGRQWELAYVEAKELPIFQLPELIFNPSSDQDTQVYGPLGYDALTNVGLDAFVANEHVHELHDIVAGLSVPGYDSDTSIPSIEEDLAIPLSRTKLMKTRERRLVPMKMI